MRTPLTSPRNGVLRVATAGSVDDGKSTLVGRLLYDTKSILSDQFDAIEHTSRRNGNDRVDLALLTDGLRAEREQGITIDVAYRYFATPDRAFVLVDTPGHVQYTRNMVTGASTADLGIVLVDARNGLTEQSRRHAFLTSLLGVPHLVLAINKMDLVGYDRAVFDRIRTDFSAYASRLTVPDLTTIPVSALHGDNVVERSTEMPWYEGPTLLHHLEAVHIASDRNLIDLRFPVQYVIRPQDSDYRGYAGKVAGGVLRTGTDVLHLPSGITTRVTGIDSPGGPVTEAYPSMSVTVRLADQLDISRGDLLCRPQNLPDSGQLLETMVCWMSPHLTLRSGRRLLLKHTSRTVPAEVSRLRYRLDIRDLHHDESADELALNDIGRASFRLSRPVFSDSYRRNRETGGFILIDPATNATAGAGMII